ncbi:MAG: hypothetical protein ACTHMY_01980 [Solirubrobacteraceae bacterium]
MTDWQRITPASIASRPVFSVDGWTFAWADIEAGARLDDSWREFEETTRNGLACQKQLAIVGEQLGASVIADAARRFRYARDLLAGDELAAWLEHWALSADEWHGYLVRMLLRERWVGELSDIGSRFAGGADELARAVWIEAVCSGFLARAADRIAGDAALAVAAGSVIGGAGGPDNRFGCIRTAAARARVAAVTEAAIAREVALHRLEWLRVDGELLSVRVEDAAHEAALCIRSDGRSLADVATACGVAPSRLSMYVADADAELSPALLAAQAGELIGPIKRDGAFALLLIETKTSPSAADASVRRRAVERIVERAVRRAMDEHLEWHEHR